MPIKTNYAKIGYYYDEFNSQAKNPVEEMIAKCLEVGYNGILFELTVPISTNGSLQPTFHYDRMFELMAELQAKGVSTGILLNWCFDGGNASYIGQELLGQKRPEEFSMDRMLISMRQFLTGIAPKAQASNVDLMIIGMQQPDFFTSNTYNSWVDAIAEVRKSFKGQISVAVISESKYFPSTWENIGIWDLLDEVTIWAKPYISVLPVTSPEFILSSYFKSELNGSSFVNEVINAANETGKPIHLMYTAFATPNALDGGWDPTIDQSEQYPLPLRPDLQELAYKSFLQVASSNLSNFVNTLSLGAYEPWAVSPGLLGPVLPGVDKGDTAFFKAFKYFDSSLFPDPLHETLRDYFSNTWKGLTPGLTFGSSGNDIIFTNQNLQTVFLKGGSDECYGGPGQERYVIASKPVTVFLSIRFWIDQIDDLKSSSVGIYLGDRILGSVSPSATSIKPQSFTDLQGFTVDITELKQISSIKVSNLGKSSFAEISNILVGGRSIDVHSGDPSVKLAPTWAKDNWILAGESLSYKLGDLVNLVSFTKIDGGDGIDTAIFEKARSAYKTEKLIQDNTTLWKVTDLATGDVDELRNIERLRFSDESLAIDLDGYGGTTAKILGAAFGKAAVANGVYAGIGLHYLDNLSYSYEKLMGLAINVALGPTPTHGQVVDLLYKNVVGVLPDAATKAMFVGMLDRKEQTIGSLGVLAAETDLNKANIDLVGLVKTGLEYEPFQS